MTKYDQYLNPLIYFFQTVLFDPKRFLFLTGIIKRENWEEMSLCY